MWTRSLLLVPVAGMVFALGCDRTALVESPADTTGDAAVADGTVPPGAGAGEDASQEPDGAAASGACGATPRRLVSKADLPAPPAHASVVLGGIRATSAGVYYSLALESNAPSGAIVGGSLWRVPLAGGAPQQVANGTLFGFGIAAVTGQGLVVKEGDDRIAVFPLSGGPPRTIFTLPSQANIISSLTSDGSSVFFTEQEAPPGGWAVEAVPLDPASGNAPVKLAFGSDSPSVAGPVAHTLILIHPQGAVESVDLPLRSDSVPVARGTCAAGSSEFLAWGTRAYWRAGLNTLETMDAIAGPPTALATLTGPLAELWGFDFDGTDFYLVGEDEGLAALTLARMPSDGGAPVALVTMHHGGPSSVSAYGPCVYWRADDGIYSLAKSAPPVAGDSAADGGG